MKKITAIALSVLMLVGAVSVFTSCNSTGAKYAVGAAGMTINAERLEEVDFSNIYYSSTIVVVSAKGKSYDSVADLSGLKVGVQEGTSGDLIISAAKTSKGYEYTDYDENDNEITKKVTVDAATEVKQYKQYALALQDLKVGRIDAILMDKLPAQTMLAQADENGAFIAVDATDLLKEDFGIALKKGDKKMAEMVNAVIDEWVADGTMAKYVDYYTAVANGETPNANGLQVTWDFGKATDTITVYTESGFAPFEFMKGKDVIGVDIAIMNEVAERNNMKVEVKDVAFDTITTCVKGN